MKTILFFTFDHFYPSGGANDFRRVTRIDGDFTPELIFEQYVPLNQDYVNVVVIDEKGGSTTHQFRVIRCASPDEGQLSEAVVRRKDVVSWVGLVPWTIY